MASLLDDRHREAVTDLWDEIEREFGIARVRISPAPHLSYQTARRYDLDTLEKVIGRLAAGARPLVVRSLGVAVFPGGAPVVYAPVVRTPDLTRFQLAVWSAGCAATDEPSPHYHPAAWLPHITLAQGDVDPGRLGELVAYLWRKEISWDIPLADLCIIAGRGNEPQEVVQRFEILGEHPRNF